MLPIKDIALSWPVQIITKGSLQYDSLIFISAFCMCYFNDGKGLWKAITYVIRKYFRLMPIIMICSGIMIMVPLLPLDSPTWQDFIVKPANACEQNVFLNLLFIQNFKHPNEAVSKLSKQLS